MQALPMQVVVVVVVVVVAIQGVLLSLEHGPRVVLHQHRDSQPIRISTSSHQNLHNSNNNNLINTNRSTRRIGRTLLLLNP